MMLILDPTSLARGLVRKKVEVVNYPDGRFAVQFNGTALGFKVFDKIQTVQPGAIVDNKRLSAVLEQVKAQQAAYPARQQRGHAARQRPPNNLEAPGLPSKAGKPVATLTDCRHGGACRGRSIGAARGVSASEPARQRPARHAGEHDHHPAARLEPGPPLDLSRPRRHRR
jgi:hypothetical protein